MPKRPPKKPARRTARSKDKAGPALGSKQARFVEEYLVDLNGKQAAIRLGKGAKAAPRRGR